MATAALRAASRDAAFHETWNAERPRPRAPPAREGVAPGRRGRPESCHPVGKADRKMTSAEVRRPTAFGRWVPRALTSRSDGRVVVISCHKPRGTALRRSAGRLVTPESGDRSGDRRAPRGVSRRFERGATTTSRASGARGSCHPVGKADRNRATRSARPTGRTPRAGEVGPRPKRDSPAGAGLSRRPRWDLNPRITDLQSVPLGHLGTRPSGRTSWQRRCRPSNPLIGERRDRLRRNPGFPPLQTLARSC